MEKDPLILHLSCRESKPDKEIRWLYVNLVFRAFEELDIVVCKNRSEEWSQSYLFEVEDAEEINNHYLNTRFVFEDEEDVDWAEMSQMVVDPKFDISEKKRHGFALNPYHTLSYVEKFDVFVFREFVEDNVVTRAALSMLEDLRAGKKPGSRFLAFSTLMRCINTLDNFWD